jgi:uncharacterized protein (TIGR02466 family)
MEIVNWSQDIFGFKFLNLNLKLLMKEINVITKNISSVKNSRSNQGGYQSSDLTFTSPLLKEMQNLITKEVNSFSENYFKFKSLKLSNIWLNINGYKDYNLEHVHADSKISGVFYIKTPKNCGSLTFINSSIRKHFIDEDKIIDNNLNNYNSLTWFFPPEENKLVLFPSWTLHRVEPNLNLKEKRISFSFNYN